MVDVYIIPPAPEKPVQPDPIEEDEDRSTEDTDELIREQNLAVGAYNQVLAEYRNLKKLHHSKELMLTWYLDEWLPNVVGIDWWGPLCRPYNMPTDKFMVAQKTKTCITKTTEAFGLLQFENSRERWLATFVWKEANPKAKRPPQYSKKKPVTHIFKSKWSDESHGKGSGWDKKAYKVFMERVKQVGEFRDNESKTGSPRMTYGKVLVKRAHGVDEHATGPPSKRRKVLADEDGEDGEGGVVVDIVFEEED